MSTDQIWKSILVLGVPINIHATDISIIMSDLVLC